MSTVVRRNTRNQTKTFFKGKRDTDSPWRKSTGSKKKKIDSISTPKVVTFKYGSVTLAANPEHIITIAGEALDGKKEANRRLHLTKKKLTISNARNQRLQNYIHTTNSVNNKLRADICRLEELLTK